LGFSLLSYYNLISNKLVLVLEVALLTNHDLNLVILDLNLNVEQPLAVPTILDICQPLLFNADWRINPMSTVQVSNIAKRPPPHISTIGLLGLSYTFGILVGIAVRAVAGEDWSPLLTHIRRQHNDLNIMMAAFNKAHFPKL
jgi:hypothetical protein